MSTAIEKNMLVAIRDVPSTGIWRGLTGRVAKVNGPLIYISVTPPWPTKDAVTYEAGPFTADELSPSPQLNLLVEGEDLEQSEKLPPRFRGAVARSFLEVKVAEGDGTGSPFDPMREVTYLIDPHDGSVVFAIDPMETDIKIHDQREQKDEFADD